MNPSAAVFQSRTSQPIHISMSRPEPHHPPQSTKLSATATPFIPHSTASDPPPPPPPPSATAETIMHTDPAVGSDATAPAKEPAAAASPQATTTTELDQKSSAEPSVAAPAATSGGGVAEATPIDWSSSKLPVLFGCHNTATPPTSAPIPFHNTWDLYADDHSGTESPVSLSSPTPALTFEPIFVASVSDVEGFWRLWRYLPPPSLCPSPFTYTWFRKDIKPEWEHPRNKKGGTISIVVFDRDRSGLSDREVLDDVFMAVMIGTAGESFSGCSSTLNGVTLKVRPNKPVTLQLWTAHAEVGKLKAFANSVRDVLSKIMPAKTLQKLEFISHHRKSVGVNSLASRMSTKPKITPDHVF